MNKPCDNDSLCLTTQKWLVWKESDICSERKSWNDFYISANRHFRKVSVNKTFTHVQEQKKAILPRNSAYIQSSVKSPSLRPYVHKTLGIFLKLSYRIKPLEGATLAFEMNNFFSCIWEAAIHQCSQKIIVLRNSHWDVSFNITVLNVWSNSLKNTCDGAHIFSKFACNTSLLLTTGKKGLYFIISLC